jgi:hypothetical protein
MRRSSAFLSALALVAACKASPSKEKEADTAAPALGRTKALYEVRDERTGTRVGFVEKATYDDGRVIYWVTGPEREVRYGYMLPNNSGYKYEWVGGQRSKEPRFLGADTYQANARKILDYRRPVTLHEIAWEELLKEYEGKAGTEGT